MNETNEKKSATKFKSVTVRLEKSDYDHLADEAFDQHVTIATFIRRLAIQHLANRLVERILRNHKNVTISEE